MLRREQSRLPGKRKETMLNRNMRNTAILLVVFLAVYMFGNYFAEKNLMSGSGSSSYSYERLESDIAKNKVKSIEVVQNAQVPTGSAIVKLNDGEKKVAHVTDVNKVIDLAQQYKVSCQVDDVKSSDTGWLSMILPWITSSTGVFVENACRSIFKTGCPTLNTCRNSSKSSGYILSVCK